MRQFQLIIFVELDRFGKEEFGECAGAAEEWCWMLKNMWRLQPGAAEYPGFEGMLAAGEIAGFSKEKRAKYDADMITERDMYNILETARQEGREAGLAEGEARVAKKMLAAADNRVHRAQRRTARRSEVVFGRIRALEDG